MWGTELSYKKMRKQFGHVFVLSLALSAVNAYAVPTLEIMAGSGTNRSTASTTPKTTRYVFNSTNPTNNTLVDYYPKTSVTYTVSQIQYTDSLFFTADDFVALAKQGFPTTGYTQYSNIFSSSRASEDIGKGISLDNNYGVRFLADFSTLNGKKWYTGNQNSGMGYEMGDITLTWDRPVTNPVINISGVGGRTNGYGIAGQFKLLTTSGVSGVILA